ncbi:hypothetical protein BVRB_023640, partial [Beta vulgaris subsp. vulgaris]
SAGVRWRGDDSGQAHRQDGAAAGSDKLPFARIISLSTDLSTASQCEAMARPYSQRGRVQAMMRKRFLEIGRPGHRKPPSWSNLMSAASALLRPEITLGGAAAIPQFLRRPEGFTDTGIVEFLEMALERDIPRQSAGFDGSPPFLGSENSCTFVEKSLADV